MMANKCYIKKEDKVKVLDFGIAGAKDSGGGDSKLTGTPMFMAPEVLIDRSNVDHRYDL